MGGWFSGVFRWLLGRMGAVPEAAGGGVCGTVAVAPRVNGTVAVSARVNGTIAVAPAVNGTITVEAC